MKDLPKSYDPKLVEERIYKMWQDAGYFAPNNLTRINADKKMRADQRGQNLRKSASSQRKSAFSIAIPPPNVTGTLHMGHALNNTLQDILIRRTRMKGLKTLWLPGIDHGGIATQNVVEKILRKEGKSRHDLGREKFVEKVWGWKEKYGDIIIDQLKKLGCSCDWTRQRFTMDDNYSQAVQFAFKHYYDKGLIYQGTRVINWCVRCQTSISDLEVEHEEQKAKLYFFRYDKKFPITIATTRPETKLGDTAVAVNPTDARYKKYVGKIFKVNFVGQDLQITIIADKSIDAKFGTGALGVTPAHSLVDAELAEKYHLPKIQVIDEFGKMTKNAGKDYQELKVLEAREKIVQFLENNNLLEKTEEISHNLSVCSRCHRPLEPLPSKQWFVRMKELAKPAIKAIRSGEIKFTPTQWKKVSLDWLDNIRDWCISRQLWWGHRLPVWFCTNQTEGITNDQFSISKQIKNQKSKNIRNWELEIRNSSEEKYIVSGKKPTHCPFCKKCSMAQSEDVLDTWFSSALWPFATLGWPFDYAQSRPKKGSDLAEFYPTNILFTARDIIFLWVARMIFSSLEFTGKIPFSEVYIHPTVFNKEGKRMSKSLGTGVDPMVLMDKYGTDATRFGLAFQDTGTQDMKFSEEAILAGKKFANKIYNASRFVMLALGDSLHESNHTTYYILHTTSQTNADKTILKKLDEVIRKTDKSLDNFRFGQAAHDLYDFFWHDFCDQYLEESKKQLQDPKLKKNTQLILLKTLTLTLTLLHPFMPFVTEEIWQLLIANGQKLPAKSIMISEWPNIK